MKLSEEEKAIAEKTAKLTSNLYYDNGDSITKSAELSDNEKAIAEKAVDLIARDYGEVIKKLEEE